MIHRLEVKVSVKGTWESDLVSLFLMFQTNLTRLMREKFPILNLGL